VGKHNAEIEMGRAPGGFQAQLIAVKTFVYRYKWLMPGIGVGQRKELIR